MKVRLGILAIAILTSALGARSARAGNPPGYAYCGTYGSYVLLYRSNDNFEELGKLRCGEKVEVLSRYWIMSRFALATAVWAGWTGPDCRILPGKRPARISA